MKSDKIRASLTSRQVAEAYGFKPDRGGFFQCPFHSGDKNGSLVVHSDSSRWHCFGCNAGGSVIDFVMKLYGLSFNEACNKLDQDFGLGLSNERVSRAVYSKVLEERRREAQKRDRARRQWWAVCEHRKLCEHVIRTVRPTQDEMPQVLAEAYHRAEYAEYWLNENIEEGVTRL